MALIDVSGPPKGSSSEGQLLRTIFSKRFSKPKRWAKKTKLVEDDYNFQKQKEKDLSSLSQEFLSSREDDRLIGDPLNLEMDSFSNSNVKLQIQANCQSFIRRKSAFQDKLTKNNESHYNADKILTKRCLISKRKRLACRLITLTMISLAFFDKLRTHSDAQSLIHTDPRPTIYSGQVSFGLLLSAHSSSGSELSTAASQLDTNSVSSSTPNEFGDLPQSSSQSSTSSLPELSTQTIPINSMQSAIQIQTNPSTAATSSSISTLLPATSSIGNTSQMVDIMITSENTPKVLHDLNKRQIFERQDRARQHYRRQQQQTAKLQTPEMSGICNQINTNALYAGMGAIWTSHQANLVGDSQLAIGTYVYDSCNDLDIGQRQSVRIVSNLNAFQQTTCEAPRGSPISLTIAHGDNQLRAIQLLTSFKVPVVTTKEHFALEDYNQLSQEQKKFLFSTAPSSRHLAVGALRFSKSIVSRSTISPKLPNIDHKMSAKNGLIVISNNLPARFINYLTELIPRHVNYVMHQSFQPIEQIKSVEMLESIFIKQDSPISSSSAESRLSKVELPLNFSINGEVKKVLNKPEKEREGEESSISNDFEIKDLKDEGGRRRRRRSSDDDSSDSESNSGSDSDAKMLSPTILMFITRSEAIDLVTRLRNDLAEVSKYYSLIVTTREDISPALKTIFYSGGSRLCPGKAFYTISPKPDDIGEFNRYFRDTVQMEGETSDHPLICEFAKYQASTRKNIDLDDISTESIIKAVWSAAAAFKSVYRQQCSPQASLMSNIYSKQDHSDGTTSSRNGRQSSTPSSTSTISSSSGSSLSQTSINNQSKTDCMVRMNKNMSNMVQRALRGLDVTINSTGLQALDGFRLKFDSLNELITNKFSIKYINKECEITELGHYTGLGDSKLKLDEETLAKSIESTLPDPWPVTVPPPSTPAPAVNPSATSAATSLPSTSISSTANADSTPNSDNFPATTSTDSESPMGTSKTRGRRKNKSATQTAEEAASGEDSPPSNKDSDEDSDGDNDKTTQASDEVPRRTQRRRSRPHVTSETTRQQQQVFRKQTATRRRARPTTTVAPALTLGGRGNLLTTIASQSSKYNDKQPTIIDTDNTLTTKQMRKLKPFPSKYGTTLTDWLPATATITRPTVRPTIREANFVSGLINVNENEQLDPATDLKMKATTQAPVFSTLPESGGNADLEPTLRVPKSINASASTPSIYNNISNKNTLDTSATTETSDYVTSPSISQHLYNTFAPNSQTIKPSNQEQMVTLGSLGFTPPQSITGRYPVSLNLTPDSYPQSQKYHNYHKDLHSSPVPLTSRPYQLGAESLLEQQQHQGRSKLRSHLKWIYSSWFTLCILCLNICGALLTLYVLTFLLMKNCDGSLERDNQGLGSLHLLAIIVVFFGSTLFIVYPTPSLCLLRTSWYNFALVMLFGTLLLQTMQIRSMKSIGLGGRPNRLNQFLTFIFIIGVQISFELQRWKYESANYINFVNQNLNSVIDGIGSEDKKLGILSNALANQLNPFNSFNDQVTPISVQVSEQYQSLLQDYCIQQSDDFLQSQFYLCGIVLMLIIFSASIRNFKIHPSPGKHKLSLGGSNKMSKHDTNRISNSQFQFSPNLSQTRASSNSYSGFESSANMFPVTLIIAPIYSVSLLLHLYAQNTINRDLTSSITMVLIAFSTLIGIFLPILRRIHRFNSNPTRLSSSASLNSSENSHGPNGSIPNSSSNTNSKGFIQDSAFAMFPEFTPTGLRRPSSGTCDSSSGSRRAFAETKESRRNMGVALANLGPSEDSLRSMGFYNSDNRHQQHQSHKRHSNSSSSSRANNNIKPIDPCMLNNLEGVNLTSANISLEQDQIHYNGRHSSGVHQHQSAMKMTGGNGTGQKRLIMLDVDPCCPKHGIAAMSTSNVK